MNKTTNEVQELILDKLARYFAITPERANEEIGRASCRERVSA